MSRLFGSAIAILVFCAGTAAAQQPDETDPKALVKRLLPPPPKTKTPSGPLTAFDLDKVFELELHGEVQDTQTKPRDRMIQQIANARGLDAAKPDSFITALHDNRPDLAGVPFTMGELCRSSDDRAKHLAASARIIRSLQDRDNKFWTNAAWKSDTHGEKGAVRIDALMQILADGSLELKVGLAKHLAGIDTPESSYALARLAMFSDMQEVQLVAAEALRGRPDKDYTGQLFDGLKHPYPPVAKRAAGALAVLNRSDLVGRLIQVLMDKDPRAPEVKTFGGKTGPVVRELVRVNHLKSCLMCHPAADRGGLANAQTAPVAIPGERPPPTFAYYSRGSTDLSIRFDVTYLRQDFSAKLPVADAAPWPKEQRFDFFVRERLLSEKEAASFNAELAQSNADGSPYHSAALAALKELTGKTLTAEEWRKTRATKQ